MTLDHFEGDGTADSDFSVPSVQFTHEQGGLGRSSPRRRRSQAEKRALVEMAMQPGTSVSEVAACFGIKASQIYGWRRQLLAGELSEPDMAPAFVRVELAADSPPTPSVAAGYAGNSAIVIAFPSGVQMRVDGAADPATLALILETLNR